MNEIFLDTETTGLSVNDRHRIVEIACIETNDLTPTKRIFHKMINPQRDVPAEAFKIHGFSTEYLKNKETFILLDKRQLPASYKKKFCDHIINNNYSLEVLRKNVKKLMERYE